MFYKNNDFNATRYSDEIMPYYSKVSTDIVMKY